MNFELLAQLWPIGVGLAAMIAYLVTMRSDLQALQARVDVIDDSLSAGRGQFSDTAIAIAEIRRDILYIRGALDRRHSPDAAE